MKRNILISLVLACAFSAQAGPYTDAMTKCLVAKQSVQDKAILVRWISFSFALHPDVVSVINVSEKEREDINRATAEIYEKLITKSCRKESIAVIKYEGEAAMKASLEVFGETASKDLITNKQVLAGLPAFAKYLDKKRLVDALKD
jgi:hypothetical protein